MLYSGTGRSLLAMFMMASVSAGGLIALTALAGGAPWKTETSPRWDWTLALNVSDRLGAAILANSWSMLGLFATILVAVALTGRGFFSGHLRKEEPGGTLTGLQLGAFDGQISVLLIGRIGFFCGNYLAISVLLVGIHAVQDAAENGFGGQWNVVATVLPLMLGGVLLSAHIGIFVTGIDVRLSELRSLERELSDRCEEIGKRVSVDSGLTRFGMFGLILWRTASLTLIPCGILLISMLATRPPAVVIGYWGAFLAITIVASGVTVLTPWMTDVLNRWSERAFRVWWNIVAISVHLLWVLWAVAVLFAESVRISTPIFLAGGAYAVPVAIFSVHYWRVRTRGFSSSSQLVRNFSPFVAMERVLFQDRSRQLIMVRSEIEDLEERRGRAPQDR